MDADLEPEAAEQLRDAPGSPPSAARRRLARRASARLESEGPRRHTPALGRGVAQSGSALRSGRRGRWFESSRPDQMKSSRPLLSLLELSAPSTLPLGNATLRRVPSAAAGCRRPWREGRDHRRRPLRPHDLEDTARGRARRPRLRSRRSCRRSVGDRQFERHVGGLSIAPDEHEPGDEPILGLRVPRRLPRIPGPRTDGRLVRALCAALRRARPDRIQCARGVRRPRFGRRLHRFRERPSAGALRLRRRRDRESLGPGHAPTWRANSTGPRSTPGTTAIPRRRST